MKRLIATITLLLLGGIATAQSDTLQRPTTASDDFWVTFIPNGYVYNSAMGLLITGSDSATVNVENPVSGWSTTVTHNGGTTTYIPLPSVYDIPSATSSDIGYHVTSTAAISLFANNYIADSWDLCCVLPTERLTTQYVVQDYPNNSDYKGGLAIVATEDSTVLTMTLPCHVTNSSLVPGNIYTETLNEGQSLALTCPSNEGFSGMMVTSNDKPFALFQGHPCARVGTSDSQRGRDHLVEQSIPLDWWGDKFVVLSEQGRSEGDRIRITAATDSCHLHIQEASGTIDFELSAYQTLEYHLPDHSVAYITSTRPVYVCKYLVSFDKFNPTSLGDAASVDIPPVHNWLNRTTFPVYVCNTDPSSEHYIQPGNYHLDIVSTTSSGMTLDGQPLPATDFTSLPGTPYYYCQRTIATGTHTLDGGSGVFYATVSGHSRWLAFAFLTGMALDPVVPEPEPVHDTVNYYDTVCQNATYDNYGFTIEATFSGTFMQWRTDTISDTIHHYHLTLTVLPPSLGDTTAYLILGDTLLFMGDTLIEAGTYSYTLTAANGCDSLLTLHLNWEEFSLTASADGICPGDSVTLTASGVLTAWWSATPSDPSLAALQGQTSITINPQQTTTYCLSAYEGGAPLASITINIEPPPTLCIDLSRPFIDFDQPGVIFTDCSEGTDHSIWHFSDGATVNNPKARRKFSHPLPDSVWVTLTSCNRWNCCVDTTFTVPSRIRSVWFPNVFIPTAESNNRFGASISFEVTQYELLIFNRWGLLVFRTERVDDLWDGSFEGRPLPQGAYVYRWHVRDAYDYNHSGIGTVTLLR
ncbi:MAG: gliding motility-associated C-terminal domain-containing protein [Bacteroidales bacterium]|nr:gliding motility-associated C-terminal domain-containing protein [Bacteroidales bacterium]